MRSSTIYRVTVRYVASLRSVQASEPQETYFSNLKRTVEALQTTLAVQGWEGKHLNYTSVYRALNERGKYVVKFGVDGVSFFQISVEKLTLNPTFTSLGIDKKP